MCGGATRGTTGILHGIQPYFVEKKMYVCFKLHHCIIRMKSSCHVLKKKTLSLFLKKCLDSFVHFLICSHVKTPELSTECGHRSPPSECLFQLG